MTAPAETLLSFPAPGLCAWIQHERLRVAADPAETLRVEAGDAEGLRALPARVEDTLRRYPGGLAAGAISYEAGGLLHGPRSSHASPVPAAVVHVYGAAPGVLNRAVAPDTPRRDESRLFRDEWSGKGYRAALDAIRNYLESGDCYQVNLARRFVADLRHDPRLSWLTLLARHPAPHACYLDWGDGTLFGVSPERFLQVRAGRVVTEPIKGSRPRGRTPARDEALAEELRTSAKDRAENLMIVDLLRNDLGQVCRPGSIRAEPLFELRRFSNVQHLVSRVTGELRRPVRPLEALLACFPGGSITGAPKRRAMEIIAELEPVPRGFYCGSFFRLDGQGNLESNILIRTLQQQDGRLFCHGGGGIVHDSDPEQEYREGRFKVEQLMATVETAF